MVHDVIARSKTKIERILKRGPTCPPQDRTLKTFASSLPLFVLVAVLKAVRERVEKGSFQASLSEGSLRDTPCCREFFKRKFAQKFAKKGPTGYCSSRNEPLLDLVTLWKYERQFLLTKLFQMNQSGSLWDVWETRCAF